jgi:putative colanic acid biosysnthesis UDP-glucose lipid carrier transferase
MNEVPVSYKGSPGRLELPIDLAPPPVPTSAGNASLHSKAVRIGSSEPVSLTLISRGALPLATVLWLAVCALLAGRPLTLQFWALALAVLLVATRMLSPLDLRSPAPAAERLRKALPVTLVQWSCVAALLAFVKAAFNLRALLPQDELARWVIGTPFALLLVHALAGPIARAFARDRSIANRYIIIGANAAGLELARRMAQSQSSGRFVGLFDFRGAWRLPGADHRSVTPNCSPQELAEIVRRQAVTQVYIALPLSREPRIAALLNELRDTTATVYFVPNLFAFDLVQPRCIDIDGMPVISICDSPLEGMNGVRKRLFDVAFAVVLLLVLWPALLLIGTVIKLTSPGPALFKQRRYGLNGQEILVYKFRTMTVCEDGPVVVQATRRDHRVTRIGAILRRTSLDELPQILNVLDGTMSFVGPRPHAVAHNEEFRKRIDGYMIRHKVRPGITGWAQVNGLRGQTSTVDEMRRRVEYDMEYLRNWSFTLDLKIIAKTAVTFFRHRNAY